MQTSFNTLVIEELSTQMGESDKYIFVRGFLNARINFTCPETGNTFAVVKIKSEGKGSSQEDVLRQTIESFMNGRFTYSEPEFHLLELECTPDRSHIHALDCKLPEPFYSLFNALFDMSNWQNTWYWISNKPKSGDMAMNKL